MLALAVERPLPVPVLPVFNLVLTFNRGVSFGMFSQMQDWMPLALTVMTSLIALLMLVWLLRAENALTGLALGFIIGGAAGNIIDRVRRGAVTDFLDFHIGPSHWPAFNVADSSIFIGVVILTLLSIVGGETQKRKVQP